MSRRGTGSDPGRGAAGTGLQPLDLEAALSPYKAIEWLALSPAQRLARAWALRARLADPQAVHDIKLFPAP